MNWQDIGPLLGTAAPMLGRLIGGEVPIPFGAQIGTAVGEAIAAAIGSPSAPLQVAQTIQSTPADVLKAQLAELEANAASMWQSFGVQSQATAETTRAELAAGEWYQRWWRPAAMFVWIGTWPVQLWLIAHAADMGAAINALALWNAGPAALAGVYSYNRTQEKIASS